jgi:hypothetical protein
MKYELRTLGHATLVVLADGVPLIATDPWLLGSVYWRSWWLEKYPKTEEIDLVRKASELYITHSHPDHFHLPSLRHLGKRSTIHPCFPRNPVPKFLQGLGYDARILEPWRWYELTAGVRMASIPYPIDDSVLIVDTPDATIVNLNDCKPRRRFLATVRNRMLQPDRPVVVLGSYSPASIALSMFKDGNRIVSKTKSDYTLVARTAAEVLGATHFVPFASQAFFNRSDSKWANEYKVTYEDLGEHWGDNRITLCKPFLTMNLANRTYCSSYDDALRILDAEKLSKIREREDEEATFEMPADFDEKLLRYLDEIVLLRLLYRRGIGWRLTTSGKERFYSTRTRRLASTIPKDYDFVISLPDQVLYEALCNGILTDLGITMLIRVDTRISPKLTYGAFLLLGLHDYGYFSGVASVAKFAWFYAPYMEPVLFHLGWKGLNGGPHPGSLATDGPTGGI